MFDQAAADRAVEFIELLKHTKGEWAGEPFHLLDWQREIVTEVFGTLKPNGFRQYNTVYIEIPKKNGKSELGAAIALYLLVADEEEGAEVYSAAADRDQAAIVFNVASVMVEQNDALSRRLDVIDSRKRIVFPKTKSYYRVLSRDDKSKHGFNSHGVIFDELHTQPNRLLFDALTEFSGDARAQPLSWEMTTAGHDQNSICWEQHEIARQVKEGVIKNPTIYPVLYNLPDKADWKEEKNWYKVNPSLGHIIDIEKVRIACQAAVDTPAKQNAFLRLRLNMWTSAKARWLPLDKWDACGDNIGETQGRECHAGLDLSSTTDLTALAYVFPSDDGVYDILMRFWIPEDTMRDKERKDKVPYAQWVKEGWVLATPGNVIDYDFIEETLKTDRESFDIKEIAFDRWGATKLSQALDKAGFKMVEFGQGFASMSAPTKELEKLALAGELRHGNNPVLRWNVDNMVVQMDAAGNHKPAKDKAVQKIDGVVACIMAVDRADRHTDTRSKYEEEGLMILGPVEEGEGDGE